MPVPRPYDDAPRLPSEGEIDPRVLLGSSAPVELEIGPGRGGFLFERLETSPESRILGLEIRLKWAKIVDDRLRARGYGDRARVFADDARFVLRRMSAASVGAVFVHFPDPWWKKRHQKRLVLNETTVAELARVLVPNGEAFLQTDVEARADAYEAMFASDGRFRPWGDAARISDNPYGARSPREHRAVQDGLPVIRLRFRRTG